jgi:hypothetical protein
MPDVLAAEAVQARVTQASRYIRSDQCRRLPSRGGQLRRFSRPRARTTTCREFQSKIMLKDLIIGWIESADIKNQRQTTFVPDQQHDPSIACNDWCSLATVLK